MKNIAGIGLIALVLVGSLVTYRWWTSPERQIRRVLDGVAHRVSHDTPASALAAAAAASELLQYFSPDVTVESTRPTTVLKGRDQLLAAAARLQTFMPAMRLEFVDVQITLAGDNQSADVDCTAMATMRDRAGQESVDAREVIMTLRVVDGHWVITHARAIEVLEPLTP